MRQTHFFLAQLTNGGMRRNKKGTNRPAYLVRFGSYGANVQACEKGGGVTCAWLDFASEGFVSVTEKGGLIIAPNLADLGQFMTRLSGDINELNALVGELPQSGGTLTRGVYRANSGPMPRIEVGRKLATLHLFLPLARKSLSNLSEDILITVSDGKSEIYLDPDTDPKLVLGKLVKRYFEIRPALEQAETIGRQITRRPLEDYIQEIRDTGFSREELYGWGYWVNGNLEFRADRRTALVKANPGTGSREVLLLEENGAVNVKKRGCSERHR